MEWLSNNGMTILATAPKIHWKSLGEHGSCETPLLKLSADKREFRTLRFLAGMSHSEVALQTGQSLEAARALQYRSLK